MKSDITVFLLIPGWKFGICEVYSDKQTRRMAWLTLFLYHSWSFCFRVCVIENRKELEGYEEWHYIPPCTYLSALLVGFCD